MNPPVRIRQTVLLGLVLVAGLVTYAIAFGRVYFSPPVPPTPDASAAHLYSFLIDVAGWYEITPYERAVASPFDLSIDARALPAAIGKWSGTPYDYGRAVDEWFENPELALASTYGDNAGHTVWFSAFGNRGRKSYVLFEHTPITSYPAAGWTLVEHGVMGVPIGGRTLNVQRATLSKDSERRIVLYWYLWSDFGRDPEKGVLTMRLHIPVVSTDQDAIAAGEDFVRGLFTSVLPWHRF